MIKLLFAGLLIFSCMFTSHAQGTYSRSNLEQASQEEVNLYLEKAQDLKKTGVVLSIAGPVTTFLGYALASSSWSGKIGGSGMFTAGYGMILLGAGTTIVGLPTFALGVYRVNKIRALEHAEKNGVRLGLYVFQPAYRSNEPIPAIMVTLRF